MFFQKVLLPVTPFPCHCLISAAISPSASFSAARKAGFWVPCEGEGREIVTRTAPPLLPQLLMGSCAQIKDEGRVNWSIPHATHHRLQACYQKDLEQSSVAFAEAAAAYHGAAKHIISKGCLPKATGQKIIDTQHGFRTENYKMSRLSFSQANKFGGNGGTEEILILEQ